MTGIKQAIQFIIESDIEGADEHFRGHRFFRNLYRKNYSGSEKPEWIMWIGNHTYYGRGLEEMLTDAFDSGEFPDYATINDFFRDFVNARKKYKWKISKFSHVLGYVP